MTIIEEKEYSELMKNEVEPYLESRKQEQLVPETWQERKSRIISGKIHLQSYLADNPKGVIIISHGFTEGAPKYDEMIYYFLNAGYHVYMPEHMGHGKSYRMTEDSSLVHIDCWKRYIRDFLMICHKIKQEYPQLPLNLFAHSMGGAIGAIAASWEPELFHKIILSSPMIRPLTGNVPWPLVVMIAHIQCLCGKEERYVAGQKPYDGRDTFEASAATSNARFDRYNEIRKAHKELQTSAASYGWLRAAIKMSWYLRYRGWKKLTCPTLIFQAEKDDFVSIRALQRFAGRVKHHGKAECEYVSLAGTKHEIYCSKDVVMKMYVEKILDFLA